LGLAEGKTRTVSARLVLKFSADLLQSNHLHQISRTEV